MKFPAFYLSTTFLLISIISLLSPFIGMGQQENFLLFKAFGISRWESFIFSAYFSMFFFLLPLIASFLEKLASYRSEFNFFTPISAYVFLLIGFGTVMFYFKNNHTALDWGLVQVIPFIFRLIDPTYLLNDFYTNSSVESPRLVFAYFIYFLTNLGFDWYTVLYFLKISGSVLLYPLSFLAIDKIFNKWKPEDISRQNKNKARDITFIICLGTLYIFQGSSVSNLTGWGAIHLYESLSPMSLSLIFGTLFLILKFSDYKIRFLSPLVLLISTLLHPFIGISIYVIGLIFFMPVIKIKREYLIIFVNLFIGIIVPIFFLLGTYEVLQPMDAELFIKQYVYLRHPNHYLMSKAIGWQAILWIILLLLPVLASLKLKNQKLILLSSLIFLSFLLAPIFQFLGTEIFFIKIVAELGPSRFTSFLSFVWAIECLIVGAYFFQERNLLIKEKSFSFARSSIQDSLKPFMIYLLRILNKFKVKKTSILANSLTFVSAILFLFFVTINNPISFYDKTGSTEKLFTWIDKETDKQDIFFVRDLDTFLLRIYAKRAVFADNAYPFHESFSNEFTKRYSIYLNSKLYTPFDYKCLGKNYQIDYLIVPSYEKKNFIDIPISFSSKKWTAYRVNDFSNDVTCK